MCCTVAFASADAELGQGSGPIHLSRLNCSGSETSLSQCGRVAGFPTPSDCSHLDDVGVRCEGKECLWTMEYC